jgi:hypothetical protein
MSRKDALGELESQVRAKPPRGLSALSKAELEALTDAIRGARHRQAAELQVAGEKAFGHIPRLLRGPIRKVMGG